MKTARFKVLSQEEVESRTLPERFWPIFDPAHRVDCWCLRAWRDPGFCWKRSKE